MFAILRIAFVCFDKIKAPCTFGSFILCSVFKGQSVYHALRDNLFIIFHDFNFPSSTYSDFFQLSFALLSTNRSGNFHILSPCRCHVNDFPEFFQAAFRISINKKRWARTFQPIPIHFHLNSRCIHFASAVQAATTILGNPSVQSADAYASEICSD